MSEYDAIVEAAEWIRARTAPRPEAAIVLGSGLGDFAERVEAAETIPYADIPHWPIPRAAGHAGRLVIGTLRGRTVAVLSGRVHYYEGYDLRAVTFAVRVMAMLGVRTLVLTNAAGGINLAFGEGGLMVIDDHLNFMGSNPLIGPHDERLGPRFPDMTHVYSPRLRELADRAAEAVGVPLLHGVYAAVHGPSYETPAEIRWLRTAGADAVGMSTVPEAIVARHMGVDVLGLSCIANMAAGVHSGPLDHEDVLAAARRVADQLSRLLEEIVARL
ncbi:MAG TPA: purine-nucleoside phosphorylase [Vicinamibacterales bacterium]|nr:purine-nucleoside phosphorylase [Vicinamibacterales bacterium]